MFNPRVGPHAAQLKVFAVVKVSYILTSCPYLDNLEFDIFDTDSSQCRFNTSVTIVFGFEHIQYISLS